MKNKLHILTCIIPALILTLSLPALALYCGDENETAVTCFSANCGETLSFSTEELAAAIPDYDALRYVIINSLPDEAEGKLRLASIDIKVGDELGASLLPLLSFTPADDSELDALISLTPVYAEGESTEELTLCISLTSGVNYAPVCENLELKTYRNIAVSGSFSAMDPEDDPLSFEICTKPTKGSVVPDGDGGFTYTPHANKKGRDSFTYAAIDKRGNRSAEATVTINIETQQEKLVYADMNGHPSAYAALRLAEEGIFTGTSLAGSWFFEPQRAVTRSEFTAMCMRAAGIEPIETETTGFDDDADIADWARPYVSAALKCGCISGIRQADGRLVFSADGALSFDAAAVMLDRLLGIADAAAPGIDADCVAAWAYQAAANLEACAVATTAMCEASPEVLTRAQAAELISGALDLIAAREERDGGFWIFS